MSLRIFCSAPFDDRADVRATHTQLRERGWVTTALWPSIDGTGPEAPMTEERALGANEQNDANMAESHVVLALPRRGVGQQMFAEVERAILTGIPVVWCGSYTTPSAYRPGVIRVPSLVLAAALLDRCAPYAQSGRGAMPERQAILRALFGVVAESGPAQVLQALGVTDTIPAPPSDHMPTSPKAFDSGAALPACDSEPRLVGARASR